MKNIGIDIGKRKCFICVMDEKGNILEETDYDNTLHDAETFAKSMITKYKKCQAVCESTGNMWIKTYESFEKNGIPIMLANPLKTRVIAEARIKTDKIDARTLAHLLRADLVAVSRTCMENQRPKTDSQAQNKFGAGQNQDFSHEQ